MRQYKRAMEWEDDEDRMKKTLIMFVKDNLRLYKSHFNQVTQKIQDLKSSMTSLKEENRKNLEDKVPMGTISRLWSRLEHEPILNASIATLDRRVTDGGSTQSGKIIRSYFSHCSRLKAFLILHCLMLTKRGRSLQQNLLLLLLQVHNHLPLNH